jgi:hypothetical protein
MPHQDPEQGRIGTVARLRSPGGTPRHPILVRFDEPLDWTLASGGRRTVLSLLVRFYAPSELEVIEAAPAARE